MCNDVLTTTASLTGIIVAEVRNADRGYAPLTGIPTSEPGYVRLPNGKKRVDLEGILRDSASVHLETESQTNYLLWLLNEEVRVLEQYEDSSITLTDLPVRCAIVALITAEGEVHLFNKAWVGYDLGAGVLVVIDDKDPKNTRRSSTVRRWSSPKN